MLKRLKCPCCGSHVSSPSPSSLPPLLRGRRQPVPCPAPRCAMATRCSPSSSGSCSPPPPPLRTWRPPSCWASWAPRDGRPVACSTRTRARRPARSSWAPGGGVARWPAMGEGGGALPLQRSLGEGEAAEGAGDWRREGEREEGSPVPGSGEGGGRRARRRRRHLRPRAAPPWRHLQVWARGRRCRSVSARPASRRSATTSRRPRVRAARWPRVHATAAARLLRLAARGRGP